MSIKAQNVSKLYGSQLALNQVSFKIGSGEIVGFLGPNGAGKSTMMKIITCYLPTNSGQVEVCGLKTTEASLQIRRKVGYLPEHNPLYLDMYVKEYLGFIASIYRLTNKSSRIKEMIGLVGLEREQSKKIGALSKGYRQRVGLAQAIIHDPEVLILDEPTSGLDPNQLIEIRKLIQDIGQEKTVMLSTHIMQEVEAICQRAIIINQGNIVADSSVAGLKSMQTGSQEVLVVRFESDVQPGDLKALKRAKDITQTEDGSFELVCDPGADLREEVMKWSIDKKNPIASLNKKEMNMEEVFKQLTM